MGGRAFQSPLTCSWPEPAPFCPKRSVCAPAFVSVPVPAHVPVPARWPPGLNSLYTASRQGRVRGASTSFPLRSVVHKDATTLPRRVEEGNTKSRQKNYLQQTTYPLAAPHLIYRTHIYTPTYIGRLPAELHHHINLHLALHSTRNQNHLRRQHLKYIYLSDLLSSPHTLNINHHACLPPTIATASLPGPASVSPSATTPQVMNYLA
jgi:hypothetical protein